MLKVYMKRSNTVACNTDNGSRVLEARDAHSILFLTNLWNEADLLSCQPRVTVTSCFVYSVIRDLESKYHLR